MSSGIVAPDKRVSEEDPATPPRPKRANNKDSPTREAGPAPADPENVTLSQLQVVPPPQKSRAIVPNKEWAQSIVSLCLIVPDEWWPEYSGDRPNPAKVVGYDPQDSRYFYFSCDCDPEDLDSGSILFFLSMAESIFWRPIITWPGQ